jgi:hypothetical protein
MAEVHGFPVCLQINWACVVNPCVLGHPTHGTPRSTVRGGGSAAATNPAIGLAAPGLREVSDLQMVPRTSDEEPHVRGEPRACTTSPCE